MKTKTVKGTNDYLPADAEIRDYLSSAIIETYKNGGFEHIITPILEDAENLDKSDGGENLNLIFKVLKRGEKLNRALQAGDAAGLSDMGLRYDLTLPLCRYYANNKQHLPSPFKAIQTDRVYRAENCQRGRLREFIQCDIDIIGSDAPQCEIELILTTVRALRKINIGNFKVKINHRGLLRSLLQSFGFAENELDSVCITFDKLDKIGGDGVSAELLEKGFDAETVAKFTQFFACEDISLEAVCAVLGENEYAENISYIMDSVKALAPEEEIVFDISLVRGQGYYTGAVFEVESVDFKGAIAGGGRYDNLIGKFIGEKIPAVGFSIGFERIFAILKDKGEFAIPGGKKKVAVLYDKDDFVEAYKKADQLRGEYDVTLLEKAKKVGKQLARLEERGFAYYYNKERSEELQSLGE